MTSTDQVASIVVVAVGFLLLWANPKRKVNRAVFASSAGVSAWLTFNHLAGRGEDRLVWLQCVYASGALIPLTLWMVKESIVGTFRFRDPTWIRANAGWFVAAAVLVILPFTELFIPANSSAEARVRGIGYPVYYAGVIGLYARLLWDSLRDIKVITGGRRLELQVWLCGGCTAATLIYLLIGLGTLTQDPLYRDLKPVVVLIFYAGTAYAITSHRIFDARQILLVGLEKLSLICIAVIIAYTITSVMDAVVSETFAFIFATTVVASTTGMFSSWLDRLFEFIPRGGQARQAAFAAAQKETRPENIEASFLTLLKSWGQTEQAIILSGPKGHLTGKGIKIDGDSPELRTLRTLHWVTPERLARERSTIDRRQLSELIARHQLGVIVLEEGAAVSVLIGVGIGASRRPYTYPQVAQLMELASIIQGAFERAHFSGKAQQAEQLATVGLLGASVAHEIRNPLVSIKTFIQLLPTHYGDQTFRDKFFKLIGDEVGRIDQLTEQLLDLAAPRAYSAQRVELHALLSDGLDLIAAKAAHRNVDLITEFAAQPDHAFTDASAAKQVILNLCFNAIQAVDGYSLKERWIKIATRNTSCGIEMAVSDSGPGIAPEMRDRLFQPFQTTKSSGFGLGLAVCSDILANLHASISVDPPVAGRGATFRVTFPCQP